MDLRCHLSPTSYMEGQAGRGGEASQGVASPSKILALLSPSPGLSPPGRSKDQAGCTH